MTLRKAFDGEVYYWYEDDPAVRSEISRVDPLRFINAKTYTQADLDQARKETREQCFKDVVNAVMQRGEIIHRGNLIKAIEAAANRQEGAGDG